MNSKVSIMKSMVVAVALVAGVSGIARADDSSMNPFTGDSYAYFNRGDLPQGASRSSTRHLRRGARAIRMGYRSVNCRRCRPRRQLTNSRRRSLTTHLRHGARRIRMGYRSVNSWHCRRKRQRGSYRISRKPVRLRRRMKAALRRAPPRSR